MSSAVKSICSCNYIGNIVSCLWALTPLADGFCSKTSCHKREVNALFLKIQDFFRKFLKGIIYPAAYPEVIAVGAATSDGTVLSGSAIGNELEFLAPGSQIISKEQTKIATELAYAEVISYNR